MKLSYSNKFKSICVSVSVCLSASLSLLCSNNCWVDLCDFQLFNYWGNIPFRLEVSTYNSYLQNWSLNTIVIIIDQSLSFCLLRKFLNEWYTSNCMNIPQKTTCYPNFNRVSDVFTLPPQHYWMQQENGL